MLQKTKAQNAHTAALLVLQSPFLPRYFASTDTIDPTRSEILFIDSSGDVFDLIVSESTLSFIFSDVLSATEDIESDKECNVLSCHVIRM